MDPLPTRYVLELDLMAHLAGLRLHERWAPPRAEPFPSASWSHISSWELVGQP